MDLLASYEFDLQQKAFDNLKQTFSNETDPSVHSAAFCSSRILIPSGSVYEGCAVARWFTENGGKLEMEGDIMFPIGTVTSDPKQLYPCSQPGFFKFRKSINFMSVMPPVFHRLTGLEMMGELFLRMNYNGRGYFSVSLIKSILEKKANVMRDILGIMSDVFTVSTAPDYIFVKNPEEHGPAMQWVITNKDSSLILTQFSLDGVLCVRLKEWPKTASEWISRERLLDWPTEDLICDIVGDGCLLVPKKPDLNHSSELHPCDAEDEAHWRVSFSLAEKRLMHSLSDRQKFCYFVFKSLFYFKMAGVPTLMNCESTEVGQDGGVSSYLAKSTLFWTCERLDFDKKEPRCIVIELFVQLITYFLDGCLPHYFIPSVNLLRNMSLGCKEAAIDMLTKLISELETNDVKLLKDVSRKSRGLLKKMDKLTAQISYSSWKMFCKNSIGLTWFARTFIGDKNTFAEILHALASDQRVIGFLMLFRHCFLSTKVAVQ